jgi:hypothetical protein
MVCAACAAAAVVRCRHRRAAGAPLSESTRSTMGLSHTRTHKAHLLPRIRAAAQTCARAQTHAQTCTCTHSHACADARAHKHTRSRSRSRQCARACSRCDIRISNAVRHCRPTPVQHAATAHSMLQYRCCLLQRFTACCNTVVACCIGAQHVATPLLQTGGLLRGTSPLMIAAMRGSDCFGFRCFVLQCCGCPLQPQPSAVQWP